MSTSSRQALQSPAHRLRQRRAVAHVKTQLDGRLQLVDILAARAGGAQEALLDFPVFESDLGIDANHGAEGIMTRSAAESGG